MQKEFKRGLAAVCSLAMLASSMAFPGGTFVSAKEGCQLLGETTFDYKMIPWHTVESSPAKQNFEITEDGEVHITILRATGEDGEKWDLQFRHRNIDLKKGHTYEVSCQVKSKRAGLKLCSQISNIKGDEYYCVLNEDHFELGPALGGQWGKAATLKDEWQILKGEFTATNDLEACEWNFQYALGHQYEGNAMDGDELWFDNMSIVEVESSSVPANSNYGYTSRKFSGLENNYISVNQVGYFPDAKKVAVLGDNAGDITPDGINESEYKADKIELTDAVKFEVINAETGDTVFSGKSSKPEKDKDSGDTVCKLDFSDFKDPGVYYIKSGDYRSFEFNIGTDIYSEKGHDLLTDSVNYFYQNRSGIDIEEKYITSGERSRLAHKGEHTQDTAAVQKVWKKDYYSMNEAKVENKSSSVTANGGWYESSSHRKNMVSGGMALWTLQNMYERASLAGSAKFDKDSGKITVPENNGKLPDILDETAYELEFMEQMRVPEDEPAWGESAAGLFYHEISDHKWTGIAYQPWNFIGDYDGIVRIAKPPTFAATLNYAACAAQAARLWEPYNKEKADEYLNNAIDAYNAYLKNYYEAEMTTTLHPYYYTECAREELNETSLYASDLQSVAGPYSAYGDTYVDDDAYWAACEIFVSASEMKNSNAEKFKKELEKFKDAYKISSRINGGENNNTYSSFNWGNTAAAGTLTLALHKDILDDKNAKKVTDSVTKTADEYLETEEKQGYGIPYKNDDNPYIEFFSGLDDVKIYGYEFGSNGMVLNNAVIMAYAYDLTGESKYSDGVSGAMDYLLGTNPMSFSFVSGYGQYTMENPNHRFWAYESDKRFPQVPDGVITGGPTANMFDPYAKALGFTVDKEGNPSQRCYVDSVESYSTNETSLGWNASLAWVASFLQDTYGSKTVTEPAPSPKVTEPTASPKVTEPTASPKVTEPTASPKVTEPTASPNVTEPVASPKITEPTVSPTPESPAPASPSPQTDTTPSPKETATVSAPEPWGDIDCNGIIDVTDLTTLAISLVDREELTGQAKKNADVDRDGYVTLADLARIRQFLSKKIDKF